MRRPDLLPETALILSAFDDLTGDRPIVVSMVGAGYGPIPWTAIRAWAECHGWGDPDAVAFLAAGIRIADADWLARHNPKG